MQWSLETSNHKMLGFISQNTEQMRKRGFSFEPMWLATQEWKYIAKQNGVSGIRALYHTLYVKSQNTVKGHFKVSTKSILEG